MDARAGPPLDPVAAEPQNFSLVLGGPLFQLLRRARLEDDAGQMLRRRIVAFVALAWLPLLVLTLAEGTAWDGRVPVPFLRDVAVHVRFLAALPLLVAAELLVHLRLRVVVAQFLERELIPPGQMERFNAALAGAMRLRNSVAAELVLIAVVYGLGVTVVWRQYIAAGGITWYALPAPHGSTLTMAGTWFAYFSLPIFQFLLVRWYFRLFIWARFLWQVSRIPLRIVPTHPDGSGGLAFLANSAFALAPLAAAHGALLAAVLAEAIFVTGRSLVEFKIEVAIMVAFMLVLAIGPLLVFAPRLAQVKRDGNREYGALAQRYARGFDAKWLRGGAPAEESLLGSGDIQSLADLGNALGVVRGMQIVPFTRQAIVQLVLATLLPIGPLLLTMMPLEEVFRMLIGVVL